MQAAVAKRAQAPNGRVTARLVIKAKARAGNKCVLRTTKQVLARKTCGRTQTVFVVTAKKGTVVYVQISGKKQKTRHDEAHPPLGGLARAGIVADAGPARRISRRPRPST